MDALNAFFNRAVDLALIVATRLAELPFALVMVAIALGVSLLYALIHLRQRLRGRPDPLRRRYVRALLITLGLGSVLHLTQRTELLLRESRELQYYARSDAVESRDPGHAAQQPALRLIHEPTTRAELEAALGPVAFSAARLEDGVEFASFHSLGQQPVTGWVTEVDLADPALRICITEELAEKRLTSTFGREHDCIVAINGEAGISPARDAPLESYAGTCISNGTLVHEFNRKRPYLAFGRDKTASYCPERSSVSAPSTSVFNAIWGRGDLLVGGVGVSNARPRWHQANPRTLMGIDATGTRLILAVIDGRQQGYSLGANLDLAARIMKAFGASSAMWCDQGGSSSMYLGCVRGIINRPSDGRERPTYTHFGVSRR